MRQYQLDAAAGACAGAATNAIAVKERTHNELNQAVNPNPTHPCEHMWLANGAVTAGLAGSFQHSASVQYDCLSEVSG